jgi:hypothetical protein
VWSRRKPPVQAMVEATVVSGIMLLLFDCIGFDFNREQSAWQFGCMSMIAVGTAVYLAMGCYILLHRTPTRGDLLFFRFGLCIPLLSVCFYLLLAEFV